MAFTFGVVHGGVLCPLPPPAQLFLLSEGATVCYALAAAAELGIADLLAAGSRTADDLASATATKPDSVYRLLRMLSTFGVFSEVEPGRFSRTPLGDLLATDAPGSLRAWVRMVGAKAWSPMWAETLESVKTGEPVFRRALGVELFEYFTSHPDEGALFDEAMTAFGASVDAAVVQAYDFTGIDTLVDVGGGHGGCLSAILRANSRLRGMLLDRPEVVGGARRTMEAMELADRCEVVPVDFFDAVPAGGDAYLLKWIVHDWDHPRALALLRNCRKAMGQTGRLLLVESVVPGPDEPHPSKIMDFVMMVGLGGRERTAPEYAELLREAGFDLRRIVPTSSPMSVVEGIPF